MTKSFHLGELISWVIFFIDFSAAVAIPKISLNSLDASGFTDLSMSIMFNKLHQTKV